MLILFSDFVVIVVIVVIVVNATYIEVISELKTNGIQ